LTVRGQSSAIELRLKDFSLQSRHQTSALY